MDPNLQRRLDSIKGEDWGDLDLSYPDFLTYNSSRYNHVLYLFWQVDQFGGPGDQLTCCDKWTIDDVAKHVAFVSELVFNIGTPYTYPDEEKMGRIREPKRIHEDIIRSEADSLGVDYSEVIVDAGIANQVILRCMKGGPERWNSQSFLDSRVLTPFGEMTVDDFLGVIWVDTLVHTWDVADAADIEHNISEKLAEEAYQVMKPMESRLRASGHFGPAVETTSDSALDQFIAFTGRKSVNRN